MTQHLNLPRPMLDMYQWQELAACRETDTEWFFFEDREQGEERSPNRNDLAKTVCARCPVIRECLAHALAVPEPYGVWGGTTPKERGRMLWTLAG